MKNKFIKISLIAVSIGALGFVGWRITEHLLGVVRLKYAVITIQKYDTPADETPIEE